MGMLKKLVTSISKSSQIKHSKIKNIFTKYGIFQAKLYINNGQEYLVIMSSGFSSLENPILYVHSDDIHECNSFDEQCGCTPQGDITFILNTISKEGGVIIYTSQDNKNIDKLLSQLNTRSLESQNKMMRSTNYASVFKGYRGKYLALDFILKDLQMSSVQLITDNPNVIFIVEQLEITISKQSPLISYSYGDNNSNATNEIIEQATAISFQYSNNQ